MGVGLSGSLEDFGIADVFQLIGQQRKTGVLELKGETGRVQLVFDQGLVVCAAPVNARATDPDPLGEMLVRCGLLTRERADEANAACRSSAQTVARRVAECGWVSAADVQRIQLLLTRDTIFEVLRWKRGSFDFRAQQEVVHDRDPSELLGAEQILMDGLRMVDEWQSIREFTASEDTVFQRAGRFETYRSKAQGASPTQIQNVETVFSLIDSRLSARRVIDLSQLGNFEGTRALAELIRHGVIQRLDPEGVRQLRRHLRPAGSAAAAVRRWVASVVPLALLLATALATQPRGAATRETAAKEFAVEQPRLESVREAYATRRLLNATQVYLLAEGRWPSRVSELEDLDLVEPEALAAPAGRPYYSLNRPDGFVLLAPER
ncbi:MAG: DUF4388 domain-containing protein [Myxococcales bacterium]|nr:DUF4388 domain-containing protein [Myxococcales bacterium]